MHSMLKNQMLKIRRFIHTKMQEPKGSDLTVCIYFFIDSKTSARMMEYCYPNDKRSDYSLFIAFRWSLSLNFCCSLRAYWLDLKLDMSYMKLRNGEKQINIIYSEMEVDVYHLLIKPIQRYD